MTATGRVVAGYDGGDTGADALTFANAWALGSGEPLTVVTVHPGAMPGVLRPDAEWVAYEREEADSLLREARALVPESTPADFHRVDAGSAAHGLSDMIDAAQPGSEPLLVLGSRSNRGMRRTYPGSTADRLLHGVAAPVAIVPWGYTEAGAGPLRRIAVAYVNTPDGRAAFATAVSLATRVGAELTVISVVPDTRNVPGLGESRLFAEGQRGDYRTALDAVVASAPDGLTVTDRLLEGPAVDTLADLTLGVRPPGRRLARLRTGATGAPRRGLLPRRAPRPHPGRGRPAGRRLARVTGFALQFGGVRYERSKPPAKQEPSCVSEYSPEAGTAPA